jgi:hypothetical protein
MLRLTISPWSFPGSQHQSACWVAGTCTPGPDSDGKVRKPSITPFQCETIGSPSPTTMVSSISSASTDRLETSGATSSRSLKLRYRATRGTPGRMDGCEFITLKTPHLHQHE